MDPSLKTTPLDPIVGQTLKQYRIDGVLGQGGMGIVYRAHDTRLQRPVALKLLAGEVTANPERRKRFLLEARAAARLSHPAIAQAYDVDEHEGAAFIAMELVEGRTVRQLVQGRELDLLGALAIALQVAEGLGKAHDMGIIHRDIKPANVILSRDGHAKILDFGLAKLLDPTDSTTTPTGPVADLSTLTQTHQGAVKGTAAYMSPEQVKGQRLDARSDLFSLGAMLFEMATGELPFQRGSLMETMQAVAFDETPSIHRFRPNLPVELQRIIARCLRKRPEDRYPDARALIHDLRVLRRDTESGHARALPWKERLAEAMEGLAQLKQPQYAWLAAGAAALALLVYLAVSGIGWGRLVLIVPAGLLLYRYLRHQPQRVLELFVAKVARLPEVRMIASQEGRITVSVDSPAGQLYSRINDHLSHCNRKLFFGPPMSVVIRHGLTPEETRQLLASPGVRFVRATPPEAGLGGS